MIWRVAIGVSSGVALSWAAMIVYLMVARPKGGALQEATRIMPDTVRLLHAIATDAALPRRVRLRLWLLFAYLAMPFDIVPDFIPVLGYADDAIIVAAVLRSVVRAAGAEAVERHWPGSPDGLDALRRLARL